jgi:hypothetical protein
MQAELIISICINAFISLVSIIGNIIIAYVTKTKNLEEQYKFNRYITKTAVMYKDPGLVIRIVEGNDLSTYCPRSQKYLIKRYQQIKQTQESED